MVEKTCDTMYNNIYTWTKSLRQDQQKKVAKLLSFAKGRKDVRGAGRIVVHFNDSGDIAKLEKTIVEK